MNKPTRIIVIWETRPDGLDLYETTDPELIDLFLECHNNYINEYGQDVATNATMDRLMSVMFGDDGASRDDNVRQLSSRTSIDVTDGTTIVRTGIFL